MTPQETAFIKDLRKVMREHRVHLEEQVSEEGSEVFYDYLLEGLWGEICIPVDGQLIAELKDHGGTRDED